jgi:hypothetical protein
MVLALALATVRAGMAQEFQPPETSGPGGLRVDLLTFSTRAGIDLSGGTSLVLGSTVDIAELWSPRVRLRPSFEFSGAGATTAIHLATEITYRFQPDQSPAIPYVGLGVGYFRIEDQSEKLWPTVVIGFELNLRPSFNWLFEYHSLDRLGRHRFLLGLAARGSGGS